MGFKNCYVSEGIARYRTRIMRKTNKTQKMFTLLLKKPISTGYRRQAARRRRRRATAGGQRRADCGFVINSPGRILVGANQNWSLARIKARTAQLRAPPRQRDNLRSSSPASNPASKRSAFNRKFP
ncbi:hypothetical protein EVAR_11340_1 [Eumeta japonica]|uniref:Uncharacterized protein n=1 Tax=Eumeta variegata TaxID=151549 RepID=A0A4C1U140_EUMVA|nr:hypothetical protein EVAR_11340_1 [Eumeta japonica]